MGQVSTPTLQYTCVKWEQEVRMIYKKEKEATNREEEKKETLEHFVIKFVTKLKNNI